MQKIVFLHLALKMKLLPYRDELFKVRCREEIALSLITTFSKIRKLCYLSNAVQDVRRSISLLASSDEIRNRSSFKATPGLRYHAKSFRMVRLKMLNMQLPNTVTFNLVLVLV